MRGDAPLPYEHGTPDKLLTAPAAVCFLCRSAAPVRSNCPSAGLAVARGVAMVSYRTHTAYERKFGRARQQVSGISCALPSICATLTVTDVGVFVLRGRALAL